MKFAQIFNDNEIARINQLLQDEEMLKTLQKALLSSIYFDGTIQKQGVPDPMRNFALFVSGGTNAEVGQNLKAVKLAIELLERSFGNLQQFKQEKKRGEENKNPAR